jgi:hypothetical protein
MARSLHLCFVVFGKLAITVSTEVIPYVALKTPTLPRRRLIFAQRELQRGRHEVDTCLFVMMGARF